MGVETLAAQKLNACHVLTEAWARIVERRAGEARRISGM
jgi:hypothetical protein